MYIDVTLGNLPATAKLAEPDDFKGFSVVIERPDHTSISVEELLALAGERADDPAWREQLDKMVAYAAEKGWIESDGSIRAHIEWR